MLMLTLCFFIDRHLDFVLRREQRSKTNIRYTLYSWYDIILALEDLLTSQEQKSLSYENNTHTDTYRHTYKIYCTTLQSIIDYPQYYVY